MEAVLIHIRYFWVFILYISRLYFPLLSAQTETFTVCINEECRSQKWSGERHRENASTLLWWWVSVDFTADDKMLTPSRFRSPELYTYLQLRLGCTSEVILHGSQLLMHCAMLNTAVGNDNKRRDKKDSVCNALVAAYNAWASPFSILSQENNTQKLFSTAQQSKSTIPVSSLNHFAFCQTLVM